MEDNKLRQELMIVMFGEHKSLKPVDRDRFNRVFHMIKHRDEDTDSHARMNEHHVISHKLNNTQLGILKDAGIKAVFSRRFNELKDEQDARRSPDPQAPSAEEFA